METTCLIAVLSALAFGFLRGIYEKEIAFTFSKGKFRKIQTPPLWWDWGLISFMVTSLLSTLGFGIYDGFKVLNFDYSLWSIFRVLLLTFILYVGMTPVGYGIARPKKAVTKDYFKSPYPPIGIVITNLSVLTIWIGLICLAYAYQLFTITIFTLGFCWIMAIGCVFLVILITSLLMLLGCKGYALIKYLLNRLKK